MFTGQALPVFYMYSTCSTCLPCYRAYSNCLPYINDLLPHVCKKPSPSHAYMIFYVCVVYRPSLSLMFKSPHLLVSCIHMTYSDYLSCLNAPRPISFIDMTTSVSTSYLHKTHLLVSTYRTSIVSLSSTLTGSPWLTYNVYRACSVCLPCI